MSAVPQPEPIKAWIIEDMGIIDKKRNFIVVGTEDDAEAKAAELGFGEDAWVSGPYEFTIRGEAMSECDHSALYVTLDGCLLCKIADLQSRLDGVCAQRDAAWAERSELSSRLGRIRELSETWGPHNTPAELQNVLHSMAEVAWGTVVERQESKS